MSVSPRQAAPYDHVPGWRIVRTSEIATQSSNLDELGRELRFTKFGYFWKEGIQQLSLHVGQRNQRRCGWRHRVAYQASFSTASLRLRTGRFVISFQSIFSRHRGVDASWA
jgi:hypothetical protein